MNTFRAALLLFSSTLLGNAAAGTSSSVQLRGSSDVQPFTATRELQTNVSPQALIINMRNIKSTGGIAQLTLFIYDKASTIVTGIKSTEMVAEIQENYRNRFIVIEPDTSVLDQMQDPGMYLELADFDLAQPSTLAYTAGPTRDLEPGQRLALDFQPIAGCEDQLVTVDLTVNGNEAGRSIVRLDLYMYDKALADTQAVLAATADSVLPPGAASSSTIPMLPDLSLTDESGNDWAGMVDPDMYLVVTAEFCNTLTICERQPMKMEPLFDIKPSFTYRVEVTFRQGAGTTSP